MTFRTSETAARPLPNFGTLLLAVLLLAGCASRGGHAWYSGPPERKQEMRETYDVAMANLRDLYPQTAWRPADFGRIRIILTIREPDKHIGGKPHILMSDGTYSRGYYVPSADGRTYHIVEPRGETDFRTLYVHEWGHVIGDATGIPGNLHHSSYRKFFLERFR